MSEQPVVVSRLGVIRRLTRLADADGFFCVAALDHPENYLALFDKDVGNVPHATVVASKLELAAALAGHASALATLSSAAAGFSSCSTASGRSFPKRGIW
jgi:hypothetical protein